MLFYISRVPLLVISLFVLIAFPRFTAEALPKRVVISDRDQLVQIDKTYRGKEIACLQGENTIRVGILLPNAEGELIWRAFRIPGSDKNKRRKRRRRLKRAFRKQCRAALDNKETLPPEETPTSTPQPQPKPTAEPTPPDAEPAPTASPTPTEEPFLGSLGKGVFANILGSGGTRQKFSDEQVNFWSCETAVAGTQLSYSWQLLEPAKGDYRWDIVEQHIQPWARCGKRVWIEISTCNKRSTGDAGLPLWIRDLIPTVMGAEGGFRGGETAVYPLFWDRDYQKHWFDFLEAFAERFDGHPNIEFISTGGYSPGHEPRGFGPDYDTSDDLKDQIDTLGYDGLGVDGIWYTQAFLPIVSFYKTIFKKTRIAQTMTYTKPFSQNAQTVLGGEGLDYIFINNGFSWKQTTSETRTGYRERGFQYSADIGFAEFGPAGLGDLSPIELYQGAIGDPNNSADYSFLSYMPLPHELITQDNSNALEAVQWAHDNLRSWK